VWLWFYFKCCFPFVCAFVTWIKITYLLTSFISRFSAIPVFRWRNVPSKRHRECTATGRRWGGRRSTWTTLTAAFDAVLPGPAWLPPWTDPRPEPQTLPGRTPGQTSPDPGASGCNPVVRETASLRILYTRWTPKQFTRFCMLHNFVTCWPIFEVFPLSESGENLQ